MARTITIGEINFEYRKLELNRTLKIFNVVVIIVGCNARCPTGIRAPRRARRLHVSGNKNANK